MKVMCTTFGKKCMIEFPLETNFLLLLTARTTSIQENGQNLRQGNGAKHI